MNKSIKPLAMLTSVFLGLAAFAPSAEAGDKHHKKDDHHKKDSHSSRHYSYVQPERHYRFVPERHYDNRRYYSGSQGRHHSDSSHHRSSGHHSPFSFFFGH